MPAYEFNPYGGDLDESLPKDVPKIDSHDLVVLDREKNKRSSTSSSQDTRWADLSLLGLREASKVPRDGQDQVSFRGTVSSAP